MRQSGLTRVPSLTLRDWLVFFLATQKHGVSTGSSLIYNYEEWGGWVSILSFCSRPLAVQCRIAFSRLLVAHRRTWGSCKWHILQDILSNGVLLLEILCCTFLVDVTCEVTPGGLCETEPASVPRPILILYAPSRVPSRLFSVEILYQIELSLHAFTHWRRYIHIHDS